MYSEKSLDNFAGDGAGRVVGVDVEGKCDDGVDGNAHGALEVVALAVLNEVVDNQDGDEEDHGLEALEVEGHGLVHDPAEDNEERSDKEGDLHRGSNGHVDSEVHLALVSDHDGCDVFGGVSDNGDEDQADKSLANVCRFDNRVDAVHEVLGADGDKNGDDD